MRPAMPSALMWSPVSGVPDSRQAKFAPRPTLAPVLAFANSSGPMPRVFTVNR